MANQYRDIIKDIPVKALLGEELNPKEMDESLMSFYRYVDLTNEQICLRQQNRISEHTWENWRDGIKTLMTMPAFNDAWTKIQEKSITRFDELRRLEKNGFRDDPQDWADPENEAAFAARTEMKASDNRQ